MMLARLRQCSLSGMAPAGTASRIMSFQQRARAYHPAEPEMDHSVVTLDPIARPPRNLPGLFPRPSHLVNEAAEAHRLSPSKDSEAALKAAMAADDARWMSYLQRNWPTLAEKKKAVHAAKGSVASVDDFNKELAAVMQATGYVQVAETGEWVPNVAAANHSSNAAGACARWSAAAAGVHVRPPMGLETHKDRPAFRNLNSRRLQKHGAKISKGTKKAAVVAIAGEAGAPDWEAADEHFYAVATHLGDCAGPLFVDDSRVVVPGDLSVRVVSSDASAMLMAHDVVEAFPASKQAENFLNGAKAINVYLAPEMKGGDVEALVGIEDDGTSRVALTGGAVNVATLRAALAISGEALMPAAEEA